MLSETESTSKFVWTRTTKILAGILSVVLLAVSIFGVIQIFENKRLLLDLKKKSSDLDIKKAEVLQLNQDNELLATKLDSCESEITFWKDRKDGVGYTPKEIKPTLAEIKDLFGLDVIKFGSSDRRNLFVVVNDPSCPYCQVASGKNPDLNAKIGTQFKLVADGGTYVAPELEMRKLVNSGRAAMVWLYSPGHGNGDLAAKALYCANDEGKFWGVHDILMTGKGYDLLNNEVKNYLANADVLIDFVKPAISSTSFKTCLKSDKYKDRLSQDKTLTTRLGIMGTPGFFVNDTIFAGAYNWTDMKSVLK